MKTKEGNERGKKEEKDAVLSQQAWTALVGQTALMFGRG